MLGMSSGTSKSQLHRARQTLRAMLNAERPKPAAARDTTMDEHTTRRRQLDRTGEWPISRPGPPADDPLAPTMPAGRHSAAARLAAGRDLWTGIEARIAPAKCADAPFGDGHAAAAGARRDVADGDFRHVSWLALQPAEHRGRRRPRHRFRRWRTDRRPSGPTSSGRILPTRSTTRRSRTSSASCVSSREQLDPQTVMVIERNLQTIDQAIQQSREALDPDPANTYLNSHLADARRRKLDLLRRAAGLSSGGD